MSPRLLRLLPACAALVACAVVPATASAATKNVWRQTPTWNTAHQGGEDAFPSNPMYAFKRALKAGADMLELDIGVSKDGQPIVMHDTTVEGKTNGTGEVQSFTVKQLKKLDGAYWYSSTDGHYSHDKAASAYTYRGIATGKRKPPKGYKRSDFQVTTLAEVMKAFPRTPINIEIKGRTKKEEVAEYVKNADFLAAMLKKTGNAKRKDIVVVSFKQDATDHFHTLLPKVPLAPGTGGASNFLLASMSPGAGVQVFQLPMTYLLSGTLVDVATEAFIKKVHDGGYAWHSWFGDNDTDGPAGWDKLVTLCVDGIMTARPVALEKFLKAHKPPAACKL